MFFLDFPLPMYTIQIYDIYPVEGLTEADWKNTWSGGDWLEKSMEDEAKPLERHAYITRLILLVRHMHSLRWSSHTPT